MTNLTPEEQRIVDWLKEGGATKGWERASLGLRLRASWNALRAPWALPRAGCRHAADAIERGEHKEKQDD